MTPRATSRDSAGRFTSTPRALGVVEIGLRKAEEEIAPSQQTRNGNRNHPTPWVTPPLTLSELQRCYIENAWHHACVDAKRDVVIGYEVGLKPSKRLTKDAKPNEDQRKVAEDFLGNASVDCPLEFVLKAAQVDYENLGFSTLEIGRNAVTQLPERIFYMPAATTRIHRNLPRVRQTMGMEHREFALFDSAERKRGQNEVLRMIAPNFRSSFYGLPDHIAAVAAILGDIYARNYNLNRFKSKLLANWAIAFNGTISEPVKQAIKTYFQETIEAGEVPEPLLLETGAVGKDAGVIFQRLSDEVKDAAFVIYRKFNRDEICAVHRVPPNKVTAFSDTRFQTSPEQAEQFRDEVVTPRQRLVEFNLNRLLVAIGVTDWVVDLPVADLTEEKAEAERAAVIARTGIATRDELRAIVKLPPVGPENGGEEYVTAGGAPQPADLAPDDPNAPAAGNPNALTKSAQQSRHATAAPVDRLRLFEGRLLKAIGKTQETQP